MKYGHWFAAGSDENPPNWRFDPLNVRQVTIFFTVYIFFQVWNQINSRSLRPTVSGFRGLFDNRPFLAIATTVAVVQVLIVSIPGLNGVFSVMPLSLLDWILIVAGTASVLVFAEVSRRVRLAARAG
jgi:Ca2+-transporting ATPase